MARISVVGTPFEKVLLSDLDKKQSLREHTINPPGQERYINPIDKDALKETLQGAVSGGTAVQDSHVETFIADTVGADDISTTTLVNKVGTVATAVGGTPAAVGGLGESLQDHVSYSFVETGHFLLSFNGGVLKGLVDQGWIKVFTDAGDALFSL